MRFMYIVTSSQPMRGPTPALMEAMHKLSEREIKAGRMLDSGGLMPVSMGAQVKITDGKLNVVDGPFVETKETLGGILLLEARDLNHAISLMSKHPGVKMGPFEIRPANEAFNQMIAERNAAIAREG